MSIEQIEKSKYKDMITRSFAGSGNFYRIEKALEKAANDTVTIAYLGGSVTQGYNPAGMIKESYATVISRYIKEKYCITGDCNYINEGHASTDAMHGLAFTEIKLKKVHPDLIFVEYAINNGMDRTYIATFESLVYKLLIMESEPAVIPVILCNEQFYTCSNYMKIVAGHYNLPTVNVNNSIRYGLDTNIMVWNDYANDCSHPTKDGHRLIADCIINLFENRNLKEDIYHIPDTACYTRNFYTFEFVDHNKMSPLKDCEFIPSDTLETFPQGWNYVRNGLMNSFRFQIKCRALFIAYEQGKSMDYGVIEIWDKDRLFSTLDGYSIYAWGNPAMKIVLNEAESSQHHFEIRMRKGDENKKFSLLGFGVVR